VNIYKLIKINNEGIFRIIGFQPAKRPTVQRALAFELNDVKNDFKNKFIKIELPKSTDMAIGIYKHFQRGEALFPKDIHIEYSNRIRDKYIISEYIDLYCDKFNKDKNAVRNEQIKNEYEITKRKIVWSQSDYNFMNYEIQELLLPWMYQNIGYRKTSESLQTNRVNKN